METETSRSILQSIQRRKLQNLLCSEKICGLCFECGDMVSINDELEIIGDGWSHLLRLGEVYSSVFYESTEELTSDIICNNCTDQLIQTYKFIQNSQLTAKILTSHVNDLISKTRDLVACFKDTELESNIVIVLENEELNSNHETASRIKTTDNKTFPNADKLNETLEKTQNQCKLCLKRFINLQNLFTHYKNHLKTKCKICDLIVPKSDIKNHLRIHEDVFKCNNCSEVFYNLSDLQKHSKTTHALIAERFECAMCLKSIENGQEHDCTFKCKTNEDVNICYLDHPYTYDKHGQKKHEGLKHSEKICSNEKIINKSMIKCRIASVQRKLASCNICNEKFETEELTQHVKKHAKFYCNICNIEYDSLRKLSAHNRKHIGPFSKCYICAKDVRDALLEKHIESHGIVTCKKCDKTFDNISLLKYHLKSHLNDIPCPKCNVMVNPAKLRRHFQSHEMDEDPQLKEIKKQKPNIHCELCDYITWNSILLECHMNRYHLKIKPYVCHICSKNFIGKHLLKKHIKSHTVDQSVICTFCGKKLANSSCLKSHIKLHTGEKNYPCEVCGEKFRSSSIMNVHKIKKHSEREEACPLCPSKFYNLVELRRHVIKIHWKKDTKFDPRELKGLENHYHLFHDGRRIMMDDQDIDFYMPCG